MAMETKDLLLIALGGFVAYKLLIDDKDDELEALKAQVAAMTASQGAAAQAQATAAAQQAANAGVPWDVIIAAASQGLTALLNLVAKYTGGSSSSNSGGTTFCEALGTCWSNGYACFDNKTGAAVPC